ncbi:MAG: NADH-quinone oxidoreductase subunit J [Armatimonadetes bacterium]|nr:NADH-quinone oxidoreductase subunit J [Armatimonadota bacterium]
MLSANLWYNLAFIALSAVTLVSALMVVSMKDMVRCAVFLSFSFIGVAGLYILLHAEYLAMIQVLVYVGAVTVLIIFAIMLIPQAARRMMTESATQRLTGGMVGLLVFMLLVSVLLRFNWSPRPGADAQPPMEALRTFSMQLLSTYLIPFEVASVVLLVALIGAIVLAKEEQNAA